MSPYEIRVMLHHYYSPEAHEDAERDVPIFEPTISWFVIEGLLTRLDEPNQYGGTLVITERGKAFCEALQRVQLPIMRWVQPDEEQQ